MTSKNPFPPDIRRASEDRVRTLAGQVAAERKSRALLLYGPGGVGKTRLVRNLARAGETDTAVLWLKPLDVDDPEYWLLTNLERAVAQQLEPDGGPHFRPYLEHLSRLSRYARPEVGRDTVRSHLRRIDRSFADCYDNFVRDRNRAVVLALDTVEVVRSSSFVLTLTQWMKQLPATLFVLSGRPWPGDGDRGDPLRDELDDPYADLPVETLTLGGFELDEANRYLESSGLAGVLDDDEKTKIVHLTRGQPLWLALTIRYLVTIGVPEEVTQHTVEQIRDDLPFHTEPTPAGRRLHEEYRRRLVTPYRSSDFWPEAIKRLTVIRQNLTEPMFRELMSDRELPSETGSWLEAWERLLDTAWIRPRLNRRSVTLHDALAEELARRIIPLHDRDGRWRRELWQWARREYGRMVEEPTRELERETVQMHALVDSAGGTVDPERERMLAEQRTNLDIRRNELDLLTTAQLYYRLLTDHEDGVGYFLDLYRQANARGGLLFRELICLEMQQLLPDGQGTGRPYDLADGPIQGLHRWLETDGVAQYLDIGLAISEYLVENEQPEAAVALLEQLPQERGTAEQLHTAHLRKGNALLRVRGRMRRAGAARTARRPADEAKRSFMLALVEAESLPDGRRRKAEALKELGFYFRNVGRWDEAEVWYKRAREHIGDVTADHGTRGELEELASICTNWAYVCGLGGRYNQAKKLVDDAVRIRRQLGSADALALSLSVRGEVLRYEQSFEQAWMSYDEAVATVASPNAVKWRGLLHQEQAICLFQAERAGVTLIADQQAEAERLALSSLDICRDHFVRHYPSALNRAGRIFAARNPDRALTFLEQAAEEARRLADTWFHVSSLIEYVELGFQMWRRTDDIAHLTAIMRRIGEADGVLAGKEYGFPALRGRIELVRAHIAFLDGQEHDDDDKFNQALDHYGWGLIEIARADNPREAGPGTVAHEFAVFRGSYAQLDASGRERWRDELRSRWSLKRWRRYTGDLRALLDDLA